MNFLEYRSRFISHWAGFRKWFHENRHVYLPVQIFAGLIVVGCILGTIWYRSSLLGARRTMYETLILRFNTAIETAYEKRLMLHRSLNTFLQITSDIGLEPKFDGFAGALYREATGIKYFIYIPARGAMIRYPENIPFDLAEGEKEYLGFQSQHPVGTQITAGGPFQISRTAYDLVICQPIRAGDLYRGTLYTILSLPPLFDEATTFSPLRDISLAVKNTDGEVVWGDQKLFEMHPAQVDISLSGLKWKIGYLLPASWDRPVRDQVGLLAAIELLAGIPLISHAFIQFNYQKKLRSLVNERTRQLSDQVTKQMETEQLLRHQIIENQKSLSELATLSEVSAAMRTVQTRHAMVDLLLHQVVKAMNAQTSALALINGNDLIFQGEFGSIQGWTGKVIQRDASLYWKVIYTGVPLFLETQFCEKASPTWTEDFPPELGAGILLPLKSAENTIGLIYVGFDQPYEFSTEQKRLVSAIAEMAGNALHRMNIAEALEKMVVERTRELDAIYQITAAASGPINLAQALQNALDPILSTMNTQAGAIFLFDEESGEYTLVAARGLPEKENERNSYMLVNKAIESWVRLNGKPFLTGDLGADLRLQFESALNGLFAVAALPMRVGNRTVGLLEVGWPGGEQFNLDEITMLSFTADHLALVVENARLLKEAEQDAVYEERARLGRELHDSVTQLLYSATLFAEGGYRLAKQGKADVAADTLAQLSDITHQALKEMRLMVYELRSNNLHLKGLVQAIQERLDAVEVRARVWVHYDADEIARLESEVEEAVYRIVTEALNNALKHSDASNISVTLKNEPAGIKVQIQDDGKGFEMDLAGSCGGLGLTSMRERAEGIGGILEIYSQPGEGTRISASIPVCRDDALVG
jgi:signal transduction histidine kinase